MKSNQAERIRPTALHGQIEQSEWQWVVIFSAVLLLVISIPYLWGYAVASPDMVFSGLLVNPIDGMSYLAKMHQGFSGSWLFTVPYTPELHDGVFLFTFHMLLGHIARFLNVPLIVMYNGARVLGGVFMFAAVYRFVADWTEDVYQRRLTWALIVLGSGFGAIAAAFGRVTPDLLILPEAFPLQAAYVNAHFPWALALVLYIVHVLTVNVFGETSLHPELSPYTVFLAVGTLVLVNMQAFVLIPVAVGFGMALLYIWANRKAFPFREFSWGAILLIFGLPFYLYILWAVSLNNPILHGWTLQNITLSPPVWDYLIAFGPILAFAGIGMYGMRNRLDAGHVFLLGWLLACVVLLYAPFALQRRFAMGLVFPLGVFAGIGLWRIIIPRLAGARRALMLSAVFALLLPTTMVAIFVPLGAIVPFRDQIQDNYYFITQEEQAALNWLASDDAVPDSVVLASPVISLYMPLYDQRVVYAHPYETLDAEAREQAVTDFYADGGCDVLRNEDVTYVVVGRQERAIGKGYEPCIAEASPVFTNSDVTIYDVDDLRGQ